MMTVKNYSFALVREKKNKITTKTTKENVSQ